jgi:hypothetical protein
MTVKQLSEYHKIAESTVHRLRRKGVDIQNPDEVAKAILSAVKRPQSWESGNPNEGGKPPEMDTAKDTKAVPQDERTLKAQALSAKDYTEARFFWTKLRSLREAKQIEILDGKHIHRDEIVDDMTKIGHGVKAALLRLQNDLPAALEGLTAVQIEGVIKAKVYEILTDLSDATSRLYDLK